MYKNCFWKQNCCNNSNNDALEDTCDNVEDTKYENDLNNDCSCGFDEDINPFTEYPMYGHAYVPVQKIDKTFKPCVGLKMGTIFPELVSPYEPCQSMREIEYLKNANEIKEGCNYGRE